MNVVSCRALVMNHHFTSPAHRRRSMSVQSCRRTLISFLFVFLFSFSFSLFLSLTLHTLTSSPPPSLSAIAVVYFEYVCNFFGDREVCVLLGDVLRHVTPNRAYLNLQEDLLTMGRFLASKYTDFRHLVSLPVFAKFLQLFQGLPKQQFSKELLITFSKSPADATSDPVSMHTAFTLAKNVHDSLDRWACGS